MLKKELCIYVYYVSLIDSNFIGICFHNVKYNNGPILYFSTVNDCDL